MARRDTFRYTVRIGNRIQKFGITNDPDRRAGEMARSGLRGTLRVEGPRVQRDSALNWERNKIQGYQDRNGRFPRGNKM